MRSAHDAFALVAMLGRDLEHHPRDWAYRKALVLTVAIAGPWAPAAQLADALGVAPDLQEAIYHEAEEHKARAGEIAGPPTPNPFRLRVVADL